MRRCEGGPQIPRESSHGRRCRRMVHRSVTTPFTRCAVAACLRREAGVFSLGRPNGERVRRSGGASPGSLGWGCEHDTTQKTGAGQPRFRCRSAIRGSSHRWSAAPLGAGDSSARAFPSGDETARSELWPVEGVLWWRISGAAGWDCWPRGIPIPDTTGAADSRSALGGLSSRSSVENAHSLTFSSSWG
jgi:hypothetical protein